MKENGWTRLRDAKKRLHIYFTIFDQKMIWSLALKH